MAAFSKLKGRQTSAFIIVATLLLFRHRLISLPNDVLSKLRSVARRGEPLSAQELADVLQQLYVVEEDGTKTLLVPYRDRVSKVRVIYFTTPVDRPFDKNLRFPGQHPSYLSGEIGQRCFPLPTPPCCFQIKAQHRHCLHPSTSCHPLPYYIS